MKNKKAFYLFSLLAPSIFFLTGCEGMNSHFDCSMKPGVMCQSLDQVNQRVDVGKIGGVQPPVSKLVSADMTIVQRAPETVSRVWIAPYEDRDENYHTAHLIYQVNHPTQGLVEPIETVTPQASR